MKFSVALSTPYIISIHHVLGFQQVLRPPPSLSLSSMERQRRSPPLTQRFLSTETQTDNPHRLPPELLKIANAFEAIGDDKLRYKQLLFMANQASSMDPSSCIPENQVPGCLSTVYVDGTAEHGDDDQTLIHFKGDSDGLLTKGLVALLVRGLSGNTAADIQLVDPAFIQTTGIAASLTPGRNNGFLNMLATMKRKALELDATSSERSSSSSSSSIQEDADDVTNDDDAEGGPIYRAIVKVLKKELNPTVLQLVDNSHQHAGHVEGGGTESHFELGIISEAFEGLSLVKRHKLIYSTLGDIMPKIHALQIQAQAPSESSSSS